MGSPPVIPDLTLIRRVGGGSYGDVWLARTITGVYRAVKVVDKARFSDDRPFLRELDGITRFQRSVGDQPRQLALMHVGRLDEQGIFYYVMELADDVDAGTDIDPDKYEPLTLKALHQRRPVLPASEVIRIGTELARSLLGLHTAGLIHRDVKPSNIIFVAGVPKLADIGLVSSSDHTLTSLGTPGYSPPEGAGTFRADLYSLGKILYQLATGMHPDDFPRLPKNVTLREDALVLLELNEVFLKACQPDPAARYASAQEMLDELMLLHAGKSVKELNETRRRLRTLARASLWLGFAAAVVIAVLGIRNYIAVRALAAQEQQARIQAEADEQLARYASDLQLAQLAVARLDLGLARSSLRRQVPTAGERDLRGPEWYALWNGSAGDPAQVFGAVGDPAVRRLAVSADGGQVVAEVVRGSSQAVVWDVSTGALRVLALDTAGLGGFTGDGRSVIVGDTTRGVRVLDLASGAMQREVQAAGRVLYPVGDGQSVVVSESQRDGYRVRVLDTLSSAEVAVFTSGTDGRNPRPQKSTITRDRRLFALATFWSEGAINKRELVLHETGLPDARWRVSRESPATALAFSPDAAWLAVGAFSEPVALLSTRDGRLHVRLPGHTGEVGAVAFSEDGTRLATGSADQTIRIWSVPDGALLEVIRGHEAGINHLAWTQNDTILFSASADGTVRRWATQPRRQERVVAGLWSGLYGDFLFLPGQEQIAVTDKTGAVVLLDKATLLPATRFESLFQPLGLADGGRTMLALSTERTLVRCELASGDLEETPLRIGGDGMTFEPQLSVDGRVAFVGTRGGGVHFWDTTAGISVTAAAAHERPAYDAALSRDARRAASGGEDGVLYLWSVSDATLERKVDLERGPITALAFEAACERLWVGVESGEILVVDVRSGALIATRRIHSGAVLALSASADGTRVVSSGDDGIVVFWGLPEMRALVALPLQGPLDGFAQNDVYKLRFSADEGVLGAFTGDGHLSFWDLRPGHP